MSKLHVGLFLFTLANIFLWQSDIVYDSFYFMAFQISVLALTGWCAWLFVPKTEKSDCVQPQRGLTVARALVLVQCVNSLLLCMDPRVRYVESVSVFGTYYILLGIGFCASLYLVYEVWNGRFSRWSYFAIFSVTLLCKLLVPFVDAHPPIDVFVWSHEAAQALSHGQNPYTFQFTEMGTEAYGYKPLFPYLPGVLIALLPFEIVGADIRYASVLSDVVISALLICLICAWRRRSEAEDLLPALIYFTFPFSIRIIEVAWNDVILFSLLLLSTYLLLQKKTTGALVVLGGALAIKQYAFFGGAYLLFFAADLLKNEKKSQLLVVGLPVLMVTMILGPFLLWNPEAFIHSTLVVPSQFPLRADSYSIQGALLRMGLFSEHQTQAMEWLFCGLWIFLLYRLHRGFQQVGDDHRAKLLLTLRSVALFYGTAFIFGHHSFLNHYYFCIQWLFLVGVLELHSRRCGEQQPGALAGL